MTPQGGTLGPAEVEKIFVEILQTNYIFGVHMGSSSQKTKLEKISTIEKLTPQGRKKIFVKISQKNYIFGVHKGSSSQKTQNYKKLQKSKK